MNHLGTLFGDDKDRALKCLKEAVQQGSVVSVSETQKEYNRTHPDQPAFIVYEYPEKPVRFLTVCQTNPEKKLIEIVSGFPFLKDGEPNIFEVLDVVPDEGGSDGTIECVSKCRDTFSFFEPLLCYHKDELKVGQKYEFSVAGIAYLLKHVANPAFVIDSGPALDLERQRLLKEDPEADVSTTTSVTFSTANLRCLIAQEEPGDAEFQTAIERVDWFELSDARVCKMRCMFRGSDEDEWPCSVYASERVLDGYEPKTGDNIQGVMWMQAHPIREIASQESWIDQGNDHDAGMEGVFRAIQAKEYFSDLPLGVAALGCTLVGAGYDVAKSYRRRDWRLVANLEVEGKQRKFRVWVDAYFPESEQASDVPEKTRKVLREFWQKKRVEVVFTTVLCRIEENYCYYDFVDKELLKEVFGNLTFIEAERVTHAEWKRRLKCIKRWWPTFEDLHSV